MGSSSSALKKPPGRSHSSSHAIAVESVSSELGGTSTSVPIETSERKKDAPCNDTHPKSTQENERKAAKLEDIGKNVPISDAEKMLQTFVKESKNEHATKRQGRKNKANNDGDLMIESMEDEEDMDIDNTVKSNESANNFRITVRDRVKSRRLAEQKTVHSEKSPCQNVQQPREKFIMDNSEILKKRKAELMPLWKENPEGGITLSPVLNHQERQSHILHQLGMQGIINKRGDPEKAMNDLRHLGMVKDVPCDSSYTMSSGAPRRTAPRLRPLHTQTEVKDASAAPWEHDVLRPNNANGDESRITSGEKIKIKMMDLDLL